MIEPLPEPNRTVHEPARLAILTVLSACRAADFLFLERATGLSRGNLSVQLSRLEEAGLVSISRRIVNKKTHTRVALTKHGTAEWEAYWRVMDELRRSAAAKPGRGSRLGRLAPASAGPFPT